MSYASLVNNLLQDFHEAQHACADKVLNVNDQLLADFVSLQGAAASRNKQTSCDFNVFNLFHINEPRHSFLLAKLLDPQAEHGQGNLFLKAFLEKLEIDRPDEGNWVVTAEAGRVDILIKRTYPQELHSVIIIENKSNNAGDQDNQLYRYWYQEIYKPQQYNNPLGKDPYPTNRYQAIYLVANDWKTVSDNSLCRPDEDQYEGLPEKLPVRLSTWKFQTQIGEILEGCLDKLTHNHRLREYVLQYIDYWKTKN